jgi:BirA family biotin operon repressor/biotin-[acetyl-CoA-carboxylase] ligase
MMKIISLKKVASTNDIAREIGKQGAKGLVVVAEEQESGRGRNGRVWFSSEGGLYASFILEKKDLLPVISAVSAAETLETFIGKTAEIRWPNDILFEGKKICGILCEGYMDFAVAGFGINVNNDVSLEEATSIKKEIRKSASIDKVLDCLIVNIEKNMLKDRIIDGYRHRCGMIGRNVMVKLKDREIEGMADVDDAGYLIVNGLRIGVADAMKVEKD